MKDWSAIAAASGLGIPASDLERITKPLDGLERDFRHAERVLNRDERLASLFVTQNLADARVEVARLRLPLQCGEKLTRSTREARVHNSVAPMCLLYHPDIFAKALGVEASTKKIAHALRELTGLPRVEPACLEGFAFQRGNG